MQAVTSFLRWLDESVRRQFPAVLLPAARATIAILVPFLCAAAASSADVSNGGTVSPIVPALQQLHPDERNAVVRHDATFSIVVREYLAAHDAISSQGAGVPHAGTPIAIDAALRLIKLGLVRRIMIGDGNKAYLQGVSGRVYLTSQNHKTQVLEIANTVDPAALFIVRVEPEN